MAKNENDHVTIARTRSWLVEAVKIYKYIAELQKSIVIDFNPLDDTELAKVLNANILDPTSIAAVCKIRYWVFVVALNRMKFIETVEKASADTTVETNLSYISNKYSEYGQERSANLDKFGINNYYFNQNKCHAFFSSLLKITAIKSRCYDLKVLYIGARTEGELFMMSKYGFPIQNITAIDLYTYTSFIELADMHNLPFNENRFDLCLMTHCIAYSEDPKVAFKEAFRVLKSDGYLLFSVSTNYQTKKSDNAPRTGSQNILKPEEYVKTALCCNKRSKLELSEQLGDSKTPSMSVNIIKCQ